MDYPTKAPYQPPAQPVREGRPSQSLEAWVIDLCECRECIDGFVSFEVRGYDTLFACPVCDRSKRDLYPYDCIPTAKKWPGSYTKYTEVEMFARKQNRRYVVDSLRRGAARVPELQTEGVGGDGWASSADPF
jgi:hypothetical protein